MNKHIPLFHADQFALVHPGVHRALQAQQSQELRELKLPLHAGMVKPDISTVEVATSSPTFHLFQPPLVPTLTSVIGRGLRTDSFVIQHSHLNFDEHGKIRNLVHATELDALMHTHRYSVAVDHFSFEWLKLTGTLPSNLYAIGCFQNTFDELTSKHQVLQHLPAAELGRLQEIFQRSHLRFVDKKRQFRNIRFVEVFEDAYVHPVHLFKSNFWNNIIDENVADFVILNFRFSNHFIHDKLNQHSLWHFNRHYSGYNLACDDLITFDELTYNDIISITAKYDLTEQSKLYSIERGFVTDCELIRNFYFEYVQSGTWTSFYPVSFA